MEDPLGELAFLKEMYPKQSWYTDGVEDTMKDLVISNESLGNIAGGEQETIGYKKILNRRKGKGEEIWLKKQERMTVRSVM